MGLKGEYEPSPAQWVRQQVEEYEASNGLRGTTMRGKPVVILTTIGAKSRKIRKTPLMKVEQGGEYAVVASKGGAAEHPQWYRNIQANPLVELQDGPLKQVMRAREVSGAERERWWSRAIEAWPDYADYARRTDRVIPVVLLTPEV